MSVASLRLSRIDSANKLLALIARFPSVLVFLTSFIVYLFTMAPSVYGLDSAELSAVAYNLGVPHATGYPLYVILGNLFTHLPFGDVAYRVNLMSAVFAAGTATVVCQLTLLYSSRVIASAAAALLLAFSYYFWSSSVVAEVYTLHGFLTVATVYLLLRWDRGGSNKLLYAAGFVWGLSFGNHMATIFLAPAFGFMLASGLWQRRIGWQNLPILVACFIPALGTYGYFPWRYMADATPFAIGEYSSDGRFIPADLTTVNGLWFMITARQFDSFMFAHGGTEYLSELGKSIWWVFGNFLGIGFVIGIFGIIHNWITDRRRLLFIALIIIPNFLFFASYGATDKQAMLFPVYVLFAIWIAEGTAYLLTLLQRHDLSNSASKRTLFGWKRPAVLRWESLALGLPAIALMINFSYTDVSSDTFVGDRYTQVLNQFEPNALVMAWWPDSSPMVYLQQVENIRPDVQVIDRYLIDPENERLLLESSLPWRPVYVFGHVPLLSFSYELLPIPNTEIIANRIVVLNPPAANPGLPQ